MQGSFCTSDPAAKLIAKFIHAEIAVMLFYMLSVVLIWVCVPCPALGQVKIAESNLGKSLQAELPADLISDIHNKGNAKQGAVLFHRVSVGCVKCHAVDGKENGLGPNLLKPEKHRSDEYVLESVLRPSQNILKGYETVTVITQAGQVQTGLLVSQNKSGVTLRDVVTGNRVTIAADEVDEVSQGTVSIMPSGLASQLAGRQQFLDLMKYVFEIRDGGLSVAVNLQPSPGTYTLQLPAYEARVDHAGLMAKLDNKAYQRGRAIYERLCINCHGDKQRAGSLPTALRFAEGRFRHGNDPYTMYKTLTHGFGFMVPQTWMVPQQKYDVIHYIREAYLQEHNVDQYFEVDESYLASLPQGDTFGPKPVKYAPWSDMNYGPSMINTFEVGGDGTNFAYKGIAVRLDTGPGGVAKGHSWAIFDHDTLRLAAFWTRPKNSTDSGFINWQGIHFNGRHGIHPRVAGDVQFENPTGPGWARPGTDSFADTSRIVGRDNRRYGPLPKTWAKFRGLHSVGQDTIIEYTVGQRRVLEKFESTNLAFSVSTKSGNTKSVSQATNADFPAFGRTLSISAGTVDHNLLVATHPDPRATFRKIDSSTGLLQSPSNLRAEAEVSAFDGHSFLQIEEDADAFSMTDQSFTICAKIRTRGDGTIFSKCSATGPWVPGGKAFFVRNGRLTYDIGWVGAVRSTKRIDDGQFHVVAMTWNHKTKEVRFFVDGQPAGRGILAPKHSTDEKFVAKIGFAAEDFPETSPLIGDIHWLGLLNSDQTKYMKRFTSVSDFSDVDPVALWDFSSSKNQQPLASKTVRKGVRLKAVRTDDRRPQVSRAILAGVMSLNANPSLTGNANQLRLSVAAGEPQDCVVWTINVPANLTDDQLQNLLADAKDRFQPRDLQQLIAADAPRRWPEIVTTVPQLGQDEGPFCVDVLTPPSVNPWLARTRLSGHDFYQDGDRAAVCSWDGDVWLVSGLKLLNDRALEPVSALPSPLKWQRIASGLFQPLGLKIVDGEIYVTCRDQLVILRDKNGDGETDFYECFNSDHQVTEHFHEFAMGLQRDQHGNFYYAKSARHGKTALVPHHGTLLKITPDGSRTDILATGFRAANGVCLNPDGSFIVTDQEGHWNPKNRINWVREGGFYGNMFGYHDVKDSSDKAMEQPLCWITNAFDRSPSELIWLDDAAWGALHNCLVNLSYGYGKVYVVPHENIDGQMQGGMCEFPIPQFPTGIHRGRLHPSDHGLYVCGLFAWASSQQAQEGGFYRIRPTGRPAYLPVELKAENEFLRIRFSDALNPETANVRNFQIQTWDLKRTSRYGSKHYNQQMLAVSDVRLEKDNRTIVLKVSDLKPTWGMEIRCDLKTESGSQQRIIHNTIHRIPK